MIRRVEALNFRSLRFLALELSDFHVIVGANGAGKSSFLDVFAFLGDLVRVGPARALLGDVATGLLPRVQAPRDITWMRSQERFEVAIELAIPPELTEGTKYRRARYEIAITIDAADQVQLTHESMYLIPAWEAPAEPAPEMFPSTRVAPASLFKAQHKQWKKVVNKTPAGKDYFRGERSSWGTQFNLGPTRSALANLPEDPERFPVAIWLRTALREGVQKVMLSAEDMRRPSPPGSATSFKPDGSNLPWIVSRLYEDKRRFGAWLRHVQQALPEISGVEVTQREEDKHKFLLVHYRNGLHAPSWVVSDGTLRLLALTAMAYVDLADGVLLIEEPENGVHPLAAESVMQALSSMYSSQVLCASHSPVVLGAVDIKSVLCFAKGADGETDVVPGDQHPRLREWRSSIDLGSLFAAGVLGSTLSEVQ